MNRTQKSESVASLQEKVQKATATYVTEYRGMTVQALTDLRNKVRNGKGEVKVAKNRLVRIALKGSKFEGISDKLKGPIAMVFSYGDPVPVAKALVESRSDTSPFNLKLGSLGTATALTEKEIEALSKLPSKEVLLAMLVGTLQAPARNFAGVISALPRNLVNVLNAVKTKKN